MQRPSPNVKNLLIRNPKKPLMPAQQSTRLTLLQIQPPSKNRVTSVSTKLSAKWYLTSRVSPSPSSKALSNLLLSCLTMMPTRNNLNHPRNKFRKTQDSLLVDWWERNRNIRSDTWYEETPLFFPKKTTMTESSSTPKMSPKTLNSRMTLITFW